MKKLIGLTFIFLTLQGCENKCTKSYVAIVNNSGKDIEIFSYKYNYNNQSLPASFSKKISVTNNSKYDQTYLDCEHDIIDAHTFEYLVQGDSIVIDYGDKVKLYGRRILIDERNPFYLNKQRTTNDFVYTLTPEDYANATLKP